MTENEEKEKEIEKEIEAFFDILQDMPLAKISRNDPCPCGSGKKYKACCLRKKQQQQNQADIVEEDIIITSEPLTPDQAKSQYDTLPDEDLTIIAELNHLLNYHPELITSEQHEYFQKLNQLRAKYPNAPVILNYLSMGYQLLGQHDIVEKMTIEAYEKFPDYLFGRTAMANLYLQRNEPEKAFEALGHCYTLKQLYPHREVFHITEAKVFLHAIINYLCHIKEIEKAKTYFEVFKEIIEMTEEGENDPLFLRAEKLIKIGIAEHNFTVGFMRLKRLANKHHPKKQD